MISPIQALSTPLAPSAAKGTASAGSAKFTTVFETALRQAEELKFSAHARQRLEERGIELEEAELAQIREAMESLEAKGARSSLLVLERVALVLNVPKRTVITAMATGETGQNVFTNIDSAVVAFAATTRQTENQRPAPDWGGLRAADRPTRHTVQETTL